jgi:hypothetical protein
LVQWCLPQVTAGGGIVNGWTSRDEPELLTEPVLVSCAVCGIAVKADPIDLAYEQDDNAEYICLACTRDMQAAQREQRKTA